MSEKTKRTTTNAIEIMHDLFVRSNAQAEVLLEEARERLHVSMQLHELRNEEDAL